MNQPKDGRQKTPDQEPESVRRGRRHQGEPGPRREMEKVNIYPDKKLFGCRRAMFREGPAASLAADRSPVASPTAGNNA
jgi:hypothetical protein